MSVKNEPCNLREWFTARGRLLTCGRPGRGYYAAGSLPYRGVPNDILREWVDGISVATAVHVVSLLGWKPKPTAPGTRGESEFKYYPFRSRDESGTKPTLQDWLNDAKPGVFVVHEFPTLDYQPTIPPTTLDAITACVDRLLDEGQTVVLMDSAGAVRTESVRTKMGHTRQKTQITSPCA